MTHPADRHLRRLADRTHPPYDGDKRLIRDMQRAFDRQRQLDRQAILAEYDFSIRIDAPGWLVVFEAEALL